MDLTKMLEQMEVEQLTLFQSPESEITFPQLPDWSDFFALGLWEQKQEINSYGEYHFAMETERNWCHWYKRFQQAMQRLVERNVTADLSKEQLIEIVEIIERLPSPPRLICKETREYGDEIFDDWDMMTTLKWRWDYGMSAYRAFGSIAEFEQMAITETEDEFEDVDLDATNPQEMCKWQLMCTISRLLPSGLEARVPKQPKPTQVTEEIQSPVTDIMIMVSDFESGEATLTGSIHAPRELQVSSTDCKTMCLALRPKHNT